MRSGHEDFKLLEFKFERIQDETSLLYGMKAVTGDVLFPCVFDKIYHYDEDGGYVWFEHQGKKAILPVCKLVDRVDPCNRELLEFCAEFRVKVEQCPSFSFDDKDIMNQVTLNNRDFISSKTDKHFNSTHLLRGEPITVIIPDDFEFFKSISSDTYCVKAIIEKNDIRKMAPLPINLLFRSGCPDDYQKLRSSRHPMELFLIEGETADGFDVRKGLQALCNKPFTIELLSPDKHPGWNVTSVRRQIRWRLPILKFVNSQDEISAKQTIKKYCDQYYDTVPIFVYKLNIITIV